MAAKKEREGQALTFGMEIVSKYLAEPFPNGRHLKIWELGTDPSLLGRAKGDSFF